MYISLVTDLNKYNPYGVDAIESHSMVYIPEGCPAVLTTAVQRQWSANPRQARRRHGLKFLHCPARIVLCWHPSPLRRTVRPLKTSVASPMGREIKKEILKTSPLPWIGGPWQAWTADLNIMSVLLWPTELRALPYKYMTKNSNIQIRFPWN